MKIYLPIPTKERKIDFLSVCVLSTLIEDRFLGAVEYAVHDRLLTL